ncbi:MAG: MFS transporter [Parcubacteria group bacterium]
MDKLLVPFRQGKLLNTLFLANIFISLHYALIVYVNSSFLSNFFSETQVSALYIMGAVMEIILLINASKILQKLGSYKFITLTIILELLSLVGILSTTSSFFVSFYFLIHIFSVSLIAFNMDVFIEAISQNEESTGGIRGSYLTLSNIAFVLSPLIVAFIVTDSDYTFVYLLSATLLIPLFSLMKKLKKVSPPNIKHIDVRQTISEYTKDKDLYNIFFCQFTLQMFYSYMIIYVPIYLKNNIGFSWEEIGIMFTIMLLPFVLFELPVGELEDMKYGEKEFLTGGFAIMSMATVFISFVTVKVFWIWAFILFVSRIGASLVEISTESYFFKHVDKDKTDIISFFRITRPLSYIVTPVLATIALQFMPFQYIFIVIGGIVIIGAHYSMDLRDTK